MNIILLHNMHLSHTVGNVNSNFGVFMPNFLKESIKLHWKINRERSKSNQNTDNGEGISIF